LAALPLSIAIESKNKLLKMESGRSSITLPDAFNRYSVSGMFSFFEDRHLDETLAHDVTLEHVNITDDERIYEGQQSFFDL
jgi:hypothetical protein